jgi:MoxR-like ATPase
MLFSFENTRKDGKAPGPADDMQDLERIKDYRDRLVENCSKVIVGKENVIELVLVCFMCSGHVLLEDVPGTGKTMLLRSFAKSVGGNFKRIQFTPDLLPSDLTGINFYNQKLGEFQFRPGPLFSNIILADEINRATPRTQSSLLEAMEERQITVDGVTTPLEEPFMVMATQNPLESYGTFPLPEAQQDRFLMRLSLGYMDRGQEAAVIRGEDTSRSVDRLEQVVTMEETAEIRAMLEEVHVAKDVMDYLMDLVEATRTDSRIRIGVSTRGAIALYQAARAKALISGRSYVQPEDIKALAPAVLAHRITSIGAGRRGDDEELVRQLCSRQAVPLEDVK